MILLPNKYDINLPENLGWLALYLCIRKDMKPNDAMETMGIKILHKQPINKSKGCDKFE